MLLLDEPLAHVGASLAAAIRQTLLREVRRLKIAALYVTHDVEEACLVGDRLLIMDAGRVLQIGAPRELYERPNSEAVARLMGIPNVLACEVEEIVSEQTALVRCGSASFHVPAPRVKDCGGADSEDIASRGAASGARTRPQGTRSGTLAASRIPGALAASRIPGATMWCSQSGVSFPWALHFSQCPVRRSNSWRLRPRRSLDDTRR